MSGSSWSGELSKPRVRSQEAGPDRSLLRRLVGGRCLGTEFGLRRGPQWRGRVDMHVLIDRFLDVLNDAT